MNRTQVRQVLRDCPDGMTAREIAVALYDDPMQQTAVTRMLKVMPDCYIDRWTRKRGTGPYSAVWVAVEVPANCPPPSFRARTGRPPKAQQQAAAH